MESQEFIASLKRSLKSKVLSLNKNMVYLIPFSSSDTIWLIEEGRLITERIDKDGNLIGTGVYKGGMLLGVYALIGGENVVTVKPLKKSRLLGFKTQELIQLLRKDQDLLFYVMSFLCERFRFMMNSLEMASLRNVEDRVTFFEDVLAEFNDPELFDISDAAIAEYLGIHPVSVCRARRKKGKKK